MRIEFTLTDENGISHRGSAELSSGRTVRRRHVGAQAPSASKSLPDHILRLRDEGFFHGPQTANETHEELLKTYHCEIDRVQMALLRLVRRRELRKAAKRIVGRNQAAYVL